MTIEQAARDFFAWFNRHYSAPSNHPDHEWNRLGVALAEPVQEPVHEHEKWCASVTQLLLCDPPRKAPCNCKPTAPPQRKPLTDEDIWRTYKNLWMFHPAEEPRLAGDVLKFARTIERAHGIGEKP